MATPEALRERLVRRLRDSARIRSDAVALAFRAVPRHVFLPGLPVEQAYADQAVATKWSDGVAISSASQPSMMAIMLEQLDVRAGHRVLEVGAGTGYNAALLAHLVGPHGSVTAIDIDEDLVADAARNLGAAGFDRVRLACQDGALGYPDTAPFDRIVLTVGSWDIQPTWLDQLAPGGRLLLPLSVRGSQLSVALDALPGPPPYLRSASVRGCAFVRLRGAGAGPETSVPITDGVAVQTGEETWIEADAVVAALRQPGTDRPLALPLAVTDLWDGLGLWLAVTDPTVCRLLAVTDPDADSPLAPMLVSTRYEGGTLATVGPDGLAALVRASRRRRGAGFTSGSAEFEVLVRPFGPGGDRLADQLADQIGRWLRLGRPSAAELRVRAYRRGAALAPQDIGGAALIEKEHASLLLDWPSNPLAAGSTLER